MKRPIYLYSYGRRRHIADGPIRPIGRGTPLCDSGALYFDCEQKLSELNAWYTTDPKWAERWMAKASDFPICQRCQKAWDKQAGQ